jgi:hypothetical protein
MTDQTHDDVGLKVQRIVDNAVAELFLLGTDNTDQAAKLLAFQAVVRIDDEKVIGEVAKFAAELIEFD